MNNSSMCDGLSGTKLTDYLLKKWSCVLDKRLDTNPTAMILQSQECISIIPQSRSEVVKSLVEQFVPQNPKNIKSYHELLKFVAEYGEETVAKKLSVHREFVTSWLPRINHNGSIEIGIEPSAGFVAAALVFFQNSS